MIAYHMAADQLGRYFAGYSIEWIEQNKNEEADALSRIGSSLQPPLTGVFLDVIDKRPVFVPKEIDIAEPLALDSTLVAMVMTHKYRVSQQSSREVKPKFIDLTQG
jgi:hypothetical protein